MDIYQSWLETMLATMLETAQDEQRGISERRRATWKAEMCEDALNAYTRLKEKEAKRWIG